MNLTEIIVALIAAGGGYLGAVVSNNKQLAVLSAKMDALKEELARQGRRIDQHNHLNDRLTKLEVMMEERRTP